MPLGPVHLGQTAPACGTAGRFGDCTNPASVIADFTMANSGIWSEKLWDKIGFTSRGGFTCH